MLINLIIILIVVGAILYLLRIVPIDQTIKTIIYVVVIVGTLIYIVKNFAAGILT